MCTCAQRNGCRTPRDRCHGVRGSIRANPWMYRDTTFHGNWAGLGPPGPQTENSCVDLRRIARRGGNLTFVGDENWVESVGLCKTFWNIIIMRDPVERLVSHMD